MGLCLLGVTYAQGKRGEDYQCIIYDELEILLPALAIILVLLFFLHQRRKHEESLYREAHFVNGTGIHNEHWFRENLAAIMAEHRDEAKAGKLFIAVLSIKNSAFLRDFYGKERYDEIVKRIIKEKFARDEHFVDYGLASESTMFFALCRKTHGSVEATVEQFTAEANTLEIRPRLNEIRFQVGVYEITAETVIKDDSIVNRAMMAYNQLFITGNLLGFYDKELQEKESHRNDVERWMEKALREEEFQIYLQPKYDVAKQAVIGAEALVRWQSPELGFLMPGCFIPIFEKNGFILRFDYYMLEHVCALLRKRLDQHLPVAPIAVNQSGLHMMEEHYLENMQAIVDRYDLPRHLVELEVTETAFSQVPGATEIVQQLKAMGFRLAMDDFCTGYSSISMLQHLPMDVMKIDRSLLLDAEKSPRALTIFKDVVQMGRDLNMLVLTEGVETKAQEQLLLTHGCEYAQGFLFGKPMTVKAFDEFLTEHPVISSY